MGRTDQANKRQTNDQAVDATVDRVTAIASRALADLVPTDPSLDDQGRTEVYDVTVRGNGRARVVEVTVDRPGGIGVDECADAARAISAALDADDPFDGPYRLDVSSPGAERPLRRRVDFERAVGMRARIKAEGAAAVEGILTAVSQSDVVTVTMDDGSTAEVELDHVVRARTVLVWGRSDRAKSENRNSKSRSSDARRNAP